MQPTSQYILKNQAKDLNHCLVYRFVGLALVGSVHLSKQENGDPEGVKAKSFAFIVDCELHLLSFPCSSSCSFSCLFTTVY